MTTEEIIALHNEVTSATTGKKFLERTALAVSGKPYTTAVISDILLHITQLSGISVTVQTAIRAAAFILTEKAAEESADVIARLVTAAISPHVAKLQEVEEKLTKVTTELNTSSTDKDTTLENVRTSIEKLTKQVTESSHKPSYAAALMMGPPTSDPDVQEQRIRSMAREAVKECQLLVDFPSHSQLASGKSSHEQLVARVKKALEAISVEDTPALEVRTITQFKQGGMIIEFMTKEAAEHVRINTEVKEKFLKNLDPNATLKERTYPLVLPFMPLTFNPSNDDNLRQIEQENGWKTGTVLTARWIKPIEKRKSTQRVAHILITLTDPAPANMAIRDGITIDKLKIWPKKNRREPLRCAKCQFYGHIARECISNGDTCANCGNNHRTSDCTTKDKKYCKTCETEDHTSWDRECPTLLKKCEDLDKRYPENTMPYFPTNEEWTLVTAPSKPAPYRKPPPPANSQRPTVTQQTLDTYPTRTTDYRNRNTRRPQYDSTSNRHSRHPTPPPTITPQELASIGSIHPPESGWN